MLAKIYEKVKNYQAIPSYFQKIRYMRLSVSNFFGGAVSGSSVEVVIDYDDDSLAWPVTVAHARVLLVNARASGSMDALNLVIDMLVNGELRFEQLRIGRDQFVRLCEDVAIAEAIRYTQAVRGRRPWDHAIQCLARLADNGFLDVDLDDMNLRLERRLSIEGTADRNRAWRMSRWLRAGYYVHEAMRTMVQLVRDGRVTINDLRLTESDFALIAACVDPTFVVNEND
jgi:hypothetical protein